MADSVNTDQMRFIVDGIENAIISFAHAPTIYPGQFFRARRTRVILQIIENGGNKLTSIAC